MNHFERLLPIYLFNRHLEKTLGDSINQTIGLQRYIQIHQYLPGYLQSDLQLHNRRIRSQYQKC